MNDSFPSPAHDSPDHAQESSHIVSVDVERVETLLLKGNIAHSHDRRLWGSNYAELITVSDTELQTLAVYKPQKGERPLWDFPDGTLCYRELLTYEVSKAIGWHLVPPTVLRTGALGLGSVQLFVEHNPRMDYFNLGNRFVSQLQRFVLFDFIVNNADRKGGHLLLDPSGKLWGIDHGLTFHASPKLRTVIWEFAGQEVPRGMLDDLERLHRLLLSQPGSSLYQVLCRYLSQVEVDAFARRIENLLAKKRFPSPGAGPNHPWPPV